MELPAMEEYWGNSLNNAKKYKKPIALLAFEFLKLYKELNKDNGNKIVTENSA